MSARWVQGDPRMAQGFPVLTAQGVETFDMVGLAAGVVVRAADETWGTAIATASAPVVTDIPLAFGSGLAAAVTLVKVSYQTAWGEGALSASGSVTPTANGGIELAAVALPTNVVGLNVYVETAAASGVYQLYTQTIGQQIAITGYGTGRVPPTAVATTATAATQYAFANRFLGVSNQRKVAANAFIFGNSLDANGNIIMMVIRGPGSIIEFDCASATFAVGDYVAPAKDSGNTLMNQKVIGVANEAFAIGRVSAIYNVATTKVCVEIMSRYVAERIGLS